MTKLWKSEGYKIRLLALVLLDILAVNIASFGALFVRFDFIFSDIGPRYLHNCIKLAPITTVGVIIILAMCKLYRSVWTYASVNEFVNVVKAVAIIFIVQLVGIFFIFKIPMPRSYIVLNSVFMLFFFTGIRFGYRFLRMIRTYTEKPSARVMIVGAGQAGMTLAKEMSISNSIDKRVVCFIDDSHAKKGKYLLGIPIVGTRNDIADMVKKYEVDEIYVAMPSISSKEIRKILNICSNTGKKVMTLPGIYQLVNGDISISKFKEVEIEDLLGRDTVNVDMSEISTTIEGKVVMVTGGGGSIGSELCRQIASYNPKKLIILDIYENNAYDIQQELKAKYTNLLDLEVIIASVRDEERINLIFNQYKPDIVFHAAAHKHVPLMEDSPNEAIKNNAFGTYKVAKAAGENGAERFVLISTDKAVNPTNIMGASKRLCEMIVQTMDKYYDTEFVAVRFGNVLGSNGSVIPLFKKQIQAGGPVTVTHPDIIRYFMTIPEAVSLVLQAATYAKGGEIFILDMGDPVKIVDLAKNLIRLSGYTPGIDIEIKFTGLRPGEKLYEEMLMKEEGLKETANSLIHIGEPIKIDIEKFAEQLKCLKEAAEHNSDNIHEIVAQIVPTYVRKR